MSVLAGITMLGAARLAAGPSSQARLRVMTRDQEMLIRRLRESLERASEGSSTCGHAYKWANLGKATMIRGESAIEEGATPNEQFFRNLRELGMLSSLAERHCVRGKAIKRGILKKQLPQTMLAGLEGATKVCIEYFRGASGKVRCAKWSSGPGYTPGPQEEDTYRIQNVRDYYATTLCPDPTNLKKCGLSRKYRYRRTLPYLPRDADGAIDIVLPPDVPGIKQGIIQIIRLKPAPPLKGGKKK